ncbi:MAG: DUF547 domain-containing protein [Betaproteobacteria bacterium]
MVIARVAHAIAAGAAVLAVSVMASAAPAPIAAYDASLHANVNDGVVAYPGFRADAGFRGYVDALAKPGTPGEGRERLAHYINAYNALAIQGILDGLSPSTLFGRARYFKFKEWPLDGRSITLYDLEHQLLRPLGEPRIHFAIVCASKSCPRLRPEAYTAARLDAQLDEQARGFVNDPSRNRFDRATRTAHLSEIFNWFDEDFRAAAGSTQKYLARYVADPAIAQELAADTYKVEWIPYDWNLNGVAAQR